MSRNEAISFVINTQKAEAIIYLDKALKELKNEQRKGYRINKGG